MTEISIETFAVGYLQTNCYLISDGKDCVVVDPGGSGERILRRVAELRLNGLAVLLTHGHFDHILALPAFVEKGYKVFIHQKDEKMLSNDGNLADTVGLGKLPVVTADYIFSDREDLSFGEMVFSVLHTPGHTEGSSCFDLAKKYLFSGDTLFFHSYGRTDFPGGSDQQMMSSLKKIFALDGDRIVYPGHGQSTTLSAERYYFFDWV